jgi:hypothetical protein
MKITKSQLKQIIKEEIEQTLDENFLSRMFGRGGESGADYRRRRRGQDIEDAPSGALDKDVPDSDHQVHVVALLNGKVVGTMKVKGPTGGYTSDQQMEDDREINRAVRALKAKGDDVQVWQETGEDAPQFQRGGRAADPQSIPGSMEQGVLIYSVSGMK